MTTKKSERIQLRLSAEHKEAIVAAAKADALDVTAFVVSSAVKAAKARNKPGNK